MQIRSEHIWYLHNQRCICVWVCIRNQMWSTLWLYLSLLLLNNTWWLYWVVLDLCIFGYSAINCHRSSICSSLWIFIYGARVQCCKFILSVFGNRVVDVTSLFDLHISHEVIWQLWSPKQIPFKHIWQQPCFMPQSEYSFFIYGDLELKLEIAICCPGGTLLRTCKK